MSIRNLDGLFDPSSVAVIGASDRPGSVGATVIRNVLAEGFAGEVWPVNNRDEEVAGRRSWPRVADLPGTPDLAVICTPAATVPGLIGELGERGTRAAIVLATGLAGTPVEGNGRTLQQAMLDAARPHLLRVLGPNCVGLLVPGRRLNASFAHTGALPGRIAFVSQSGAITTAMLDWARTRGIGFSHFISLGDGADIDAGDVLDYLGYSAQTDSVLMYLESVMHARKFMSAARAAARNKPVLVVKAGRAPAGARAATSHTGALTGSDEVFDAAVRRAGLLRVSTLSELFSAAETLGRASRRDGERLAVMTNGGGIGVLAADELTLRGGTLAQLSAATTTALDAVLPPTWSHANPVDIIGDAPVERYVETLRILLADEGVDAVLVMHAPTAIVSSLEIARACVEVARTSAGRVLACMVGGETLEAARREFNAAGVPCYDTPEQAVAAFAHLAEYRRNQVLLMQTPPSVPQDFAPDLATARRLVGDALRNDRPVLTEPQAKALLAAYGIPVTETRTVATPDAAAEAATEIGFPAVLKILSPQLTHKSEVEGVALALGSADEVRSAANSMLRRVGILRPDATVTGFVVQPMVEHPQAIELIVGVTRDPVFGPVILFGRGGTAVEQIADEAVALPPLNVLLARDLMVRTRVWRRLVGYRDHPPADLAAIERTLLGVSQLVCDLPEVAELDINPLLAGAQGVIALDARVRVQPLGPGEPGLSIRPYPKELEEHIRFLERDVLLRPIRPEDEPLIREFIAESDPEDLRYRFFATIRSLPHSQLARLAQIDYEREMAFLAVADGDGHEEELLGVVRTIADPNNESAEQAIIVRSDLKRRGLGRVLWGKALRYLESRGTRQAVAECLTSNTNMIQLAREFDFQVRSAPDGQTLLLTRQLPSG